MEVSVGSPIWRSLPSSNSTVPSQHSAAYCKSFLITAELLSPISSKTEAPSAKAFTRVIWFWVKVPVLSEQITEALPRVSTAGNLLIIAFFFTIRCTPMARTIVTIAGRPSGIAETASATAIMKISMTFMPSIKPIIKMTAHIPRAKSPRYLPSTASRCCKGVCLSLAASRSLAILPISVCIPVAVITARALP